MFIGIVEWLGSENYRHLWTPPFFKWPSSLYVYCICMYYIVRFQMDVQFLNS